MYIKVNANLVVRQDGVYKIVLLDVDPLIDDVIESREVKISGPVEFMFPISETGEFRPELKLKIFNSNNDLVFESITDNSISSIDTDHVTGRFEKTTVDFGEIVIGG